MRALVKNGIWLVLLAIVALTLEAQAQLRIMPMGDSITHGTTSVNSYRRPLWQMLTNAGLNVDFVGTFTNNVNGNPPNPDFDRDHQSVAGYKVEDLLNFMNEWLAENTPDCVLLHIGSNDRLAGQSIASTTNEISQVIDRLRVINPKVQVIVARIIPYTTAYSGGDSIPALNTAIGELALAKTTPQSRVVTVDQFTGFDPVANNYDGLHPNASGELKMATNWFNALTNLLGTGTNIAPVAEVLEPWSGQTFLAPAAIRIAARAFDIDGFLTNVELFANGIKIAETNAAPFSWVLNNAPLGSNTYWIVAHDNLGLVKTSSVVVAYVNPVPAFFRAMNLNGPAVTIEGKPWISGAAAVSSGLSVSGGGTFTGVTYGFPLIPSPDTNTYAMLGSGWFRSGVANGQGLNITQTVSNGFFHVWIYTLENNAPRFRNMNVFLEGSQVATNIGNLNRGEWRSYGPYLTLVNDGVLNLDLLRYTKGEPVVCGIVIAAATFPSAVSNAPPTLSSFANQVIGEDQTTGPLAFTVNDPDHAPGELLVSASSLNPTLLPNGSIVVGGSGSNRTVTVTPAANASGSATVSVVVADPFGGSATNSFLLTVNPVEDPPTIAITAPINLALQPPGSPIPINVSATDPEGLIVSVNLFADGSLLTNWTGAPFSYIWTNASLGFHELVAVVTDGAGLMATSAIVNVQVAVPPPYYRGINLAGPSAMVEGQAWLSDFDAKAQGFSITNATGAFGSYGFAPTPAADSGTLTMLQGRYYRLNPANGQGINMTQTIVNGAYEVYLWVLEDFVNNQRSMNVFLEGAQVATNIGDLPKEQWAKYGPYPVVVSDGLLNIDVVRSFKGDPLLMGLLIQSAVPPEENTAPNISGLVDQSTPEDTLLGPLPFSISDSESAPNVLTLSAISGNPNLLPVTNIVFGGTGTNRTVTVLPGANQTGTAALSVIVSDPYGATATNTFNVTVTPVNDAPTVAIVSPVNLSAYNPPANVPVNISATDVDDVVATVQVFGDGLPLVTFTNAPYSLTWSNLALGAHTLVAVASDTLGASATSAVVTVNVTSEPVYFRGINLAGSAVTIEGRQWLSDSAARADGMTVTNATQGNGSYPFTIVPTVNADTQTMLQGRYYTLNPPPGQGFHIGQTLPNGNYEVFLWALEDSSDNFRAINIFLEGVQVATNIGDLPRGSWAKYGPYPVTVTDGQLNLSAVRGSKGDPLLNGIVIRTAIPPNSAPFVNLTSPTNGAVFDTDDTILLTASAGDVDGTLATVAFLANGNPIISFSNAPYSFSWTHAPLGAQLLTAVATDSLGASTTSAVVSVLVTNINDAPVATNQSFTVTEDVPLLLTFNVSDVDSTNFTFAIVTNPANGTLTGFNPANGTVTYTPNANFFGTNSLAFTVSDGFATSSVAVVSISVAAVNDAPTALAQSLTGTEDVALPIILEVVDVDSTNLTFFIVTNSVNGALIDFNPTNGTLTYVPAADFVGPDTFSFEVSDGSITSIVAVVSIAITNINDAPVATNQSFTVTEDVPLLLTLSVSDVDSTNFIFTILTNPANGTLNGFNPTNGTVTYTPYTNFFGTNVLAFTVSDGQLTSGVAIVSLLVTNVNDAPVATLDHPLSGAAFAIGATVNFTATVTDPDNNLASVTFLTGDAPLAIFTNGPFAFAWTNAPVGVHQLAAVATDLTGLSTTSAIATISVTNSAPTIAITTPTNSAAFNVGVTVPISITATDAENNLTTVQLLANGLELTVFTNAPFDFSWTNAPVGTHLLTAIATDALGLATTSSIVTVQVLNTAPTIAVTAPADQAVFAQGTWVPITASASDAEGNLATVQLLANGSPLTQFTNPPFAFDWTNAPAGIHQLTAIATDALGLATTSSVVTIYVTNQAPTVVITGLTNDTLIVLGNPVLLTATAADADGAVAHVKFYSGETLLGEGAGLDYQFLWTNAPLGNATLTAVATDNFGLATTSAPVSIAIVLVPQLTIVNDLDGNALLTLTGETNRTYLITASTNVTDWLPVHTNVTTNGTFNWTDTASAPETQRFYRAQPRP